VHAFGSESMLMVVALCIIIGPTLATRFRFPALVGLVLGGTLVGPYVLGWLHEGQIDSLGNIGLLYLMFQAGLEIDLAMFARNRRGAITFGMLTFTLPLVAGAMVGWWLGMATAAALLIGSIWASHTLVTLPDVRAAGLGQNRAVTVTAGATVITDTLALIILAVVAATSAGGSPAAVIGELGIGLAVLGFYTMWALPTITHNFFTGAGRERTLRFVALVFGFASAATIAVAFGIEGLVGAFLAGLGLNRLVPNGGALMERVDFFGTSLLVPAFLVYVGTKINPAVAFRLSTLELAGLFLAALLVGKLLAAIIGGKILRFTAGEIRLTFGMSVPQAAATLAATLVGADIGLFSEAVVNAVVVVVVASMVIGALMTRTAIALIPAAEEEERPLGTNVMVAVTPTNHMDGLMRVAAAIARADAGNVKPIVVSTVEQGTLKESEELSEEAEAAARAEGADAEGRVRRSASLVEGVLEAIDEEHASLLLTQWEGSLSASALAFGTALDQIGRRCPVPMAAGRFEADGFIRVILTLEPMGPARRALDSRIAAPLALALASPKDVQLLVLTPKGVDPTRFGIDPTADHVTIAESEPGPRMYVPGGLREGDLLVMPARVARRLRSVAPGFAQMHKGTSVLIAAGPRRFALVPGTVRTGNYLGVTSGIGSTRSL